jgi:hypothetical protein
MPFTRIKRGKKRGKYRSPSGRVFSRKQIKLYYATKGFQKRLMRRKRKKR